MTFLAMMVRLLRSQWWDKERIATYQQHRLLEMMKYAVDNVPFYAGLGISAADLRSHEDLQRFPIVTKADLQERADEFLSREFAKQRLHTSKSSGMTGEPVVTYFDDASWLLSKHALKARRALMSAKSLRQRILIITEQTHWPTAPAVGRWLLDIHGISLMEDIHRNLETLARFAPTVIYGFPSYLLALVDVAAESGVKLPRVRLVCTSSEVLTARARATPEARGWAWRS